MITRLLVTGASGFVGRQVLAQLGNREEVEVVALTSKRASPPSLGSCRWMQGDLLVPGSARRLVDQVQPSHLLHLAWEATPGTYLTSRRNLAWLAASAELIDAFASSGGKRFVGTGTCLEYDVTAGGLCEESRTPLRPGTLYGACKQGFGTSAVEAGRTEGVSVAWARLFHLYGPHEHPERLVAYIARALLNGEEAGLSDGSQQRDYLGVTDAAAALVSLLMSDVEGAVNIGSGRVVSVREVAEITARICGGEHLLRFGSRFTQEGVISFLAPDITRLADEVGWRPESTLEEGLRRTVSWWEEELRASAPENG